MPRLHFQSAFILLGLLVSACGVSRAGLIFQDPFNPAPSPDWSNSVGDWAGGGGVYYAQMPNNNPLTYTGLPFDLTDFEVTIDVNAVGDGGIWLRSDGSDRNGVLLVLGGDGYGEGTRGGDSGTDIYWHDVQNGGVGNGLGLVQFVFTPGDNYSLLVTVIGDVYSAYVDGSSTPVSTVTIDTYTHGYVGLYDNQPGPGGSGPLMSFSNFAIYSVPEPSMMPLLALGCVGLLSYRNRRPA